MAVSSVLRLASGSHATVLESWSLLDIPERSSRERPYWLVVVTSRVSASVHRLIAWQSTHADA